MAKRLKSRISTMKEQTNNVRGKKDNVVVNAVKMQTEAALIESMSKSTTLAIMVVAGVAVFVSLFIIFL
jgi:hypothetical protein